MQALPLAVSGAVTLRMEFRTFGLQGCNTTTGRVMCARAGNSRRACSVAHMRVTAERSGPPLYSYIWIRRYATGRSRLTRVTTNVKAFLIAIADLPNSRDRIISYGNGLLSQQPINPRSVLKLHQVSAS